MKTRLYKDITTNTIKTFAEIKNEYETLIEAELPIDNDTMQSIILENLCSIGGNIQIITSSNNKILEWCNDYAERVEADRVMSQEEIDESIKELYFAILENDEDLLQGTKDNLYEDDAEDVILLERLEKLTV